MALSIEKFYERYAPLVMRRCRQLLKNEALAAEAMQDTFVQLIRYRNTLTDTAPSSLLYRIATNICLNKIRDNKAFSLQEPEEVLQNIAHHGDFFEQILSYSFLQKIFEKEPSSTRLIATLFYVDQMTLEEIAKTVNLSVSGVRKRLRKVKNLAETARGDI